MSMGNIPQQLGQGVLHGEGIAGGAAHAINPTLGKVYDIGNAVAGAALPFAGGPLAGAAPLTAGGAGGGLGTFSQMTPQLLKLIQMMSQNRTQ